MAKKVAKVAKAPKKAEPKKIDLTKKTNVNKTELIASVAKKVNVPHKNVAAVIDSTLDEIAAQLKRGKAVTITGFGSFKVQKYKARKGRNLRTGEAIKIPAGKRVKFSAGKSLKNTVSPQK